MLYTDATHLKANAHKNKFEVQRAKPFEYLGELEQTIMEDRAAHRRGEAEASVSARKKIKVRRVIRRRDCMVAGRQAQGFFCVDRRMADGNKHTIITDTPSTPASMHDLVPYLERLDRQRERFGFLVSSAVGQDAAMRRQRLRRD